MSEKQRERWQHQRQAAIKEVLTPERYRAYLRMQDPLYRQAQLYAQQYGAPARAVQPLYDMSKAIENQRRQITNNAGLNPQQKAAELQRLNVEQQRNIQRIITEINAAR